jgi:hypothetical protein
MDLKTRFARIENTVEEIKVMVTPVCEDYTYRRRRMQERMAMAKRITTYLGVPSALLGVILIGVKLLDMFN